MKTLKTKLLDKATLDLFWSAHRRASRHKAHRSEVLKFNLNEEENLLNIVDVVRSGRYRPSAYRSFWVHDPKLRLIQALPYQDRIVHQWAVEEFYKPYFFPRFIRDSYACIDGRGTHQAVDRAQELLERLIRTTNGHGYIMKMDISKYFNSIDPQILFNILARVIADSRLVDLTRSFIFDNGESDIGIPIGNYTSQLFANIYLDRLDQFVKSELRVGGYVRYMDDFVLFVPGKATAVYLYGVIEQFINSKLHLRLNPKSCYYPCYMGLNFAGYKIYDGYRLLRRRSKNKLREIITSYERGWDNTDKFVLRVNSWHGHASHADTHRYIQHQLSPYRELLPTIFDTASDKAPGQTIAEQAK